MQLIANEVEGEMGIVNRGVTLSSPRAMAERSLKRDRMTTVQVGISRSRMTMAKKKKRLMNREQAIL